ncbi:cytochrome bd-I ubiquinol oxidase subunit 2 apoprotein [Sinobacterium caligoides]|uniref:Cytochrome bd-I ubiquinol oxidase subunit 2 apoprotein n=1 Tax=Sinobacterium caligoides TaxID=933926 RepID=A0A3N2DQD0_9GAMM|nr:cytochrome d ubiquinol oxidase subunit II [Sinobacterium caligoides]ROS02041.1 cytochrome bd-I ubiquinol oxidase subunit 2 apoprotein [Sinobacterium caligoides]
MDYESLKFIWWVLIGVLFTGFAITDGFDMGVGGLLRILGKDNDERRIMLNSIAPHWDGNQVWLITAGGALFAVWPMVYAASFSGFYFAMMLTLVALWLRPLGFDYRSKIDNAKWRNYWDWAIVFGSSIPPLIFGVAFGNLLQGVPFQYDEIMRVSYTGSFFGLLNPFALLAGFVSVLMIFTQGSSWLQMKTEGELQARSRNLTIKLAPITAVLFALAGVWVATGIEGYVISSQVDGNAVLTPMMKTVAVQPGGWLNNYLQYPLLIAAPILGIAGMLAAALASYLQRSGVAFVASSLAIAGIIFTAGGSMFPFLMPSSTNPATSLTMWDATSSEYTLTLATIVACIFVPIILSYTAWGYWTMRGKLSKQHIQDNSHSLY